MKTRTMKFSCLKKYNLFRKKTVNFRIIIFFFIEAVLTITPNLCFRNDVVLKSTAIHILEQKQEKKIFIALQSPLFLREVVFVTGIFITKAGYLNILS